MLSKGFFHLQGDCTCIWHCPYRLAVVATEGLYARQLTSVHVWYWSGKSLLRSNGNTYSIEPSFGMIVEGLQANDKSTIDWIAGGVKLILPVLISLAKPISSTIKLTVVNRLTKRCEQSCNNKFEHWIFMLESELFYKKIIMFFSDKSRRIYGTQSRRF